MGKELSGYEATIVKKAARKAGLKIGDRVYTTKGDRKSPGARGVIVGFTMVTSRAQYNDFPAAIVKKTYYESALGKTRTFLIKNLHKA